MNLRTITSGIGVAAAALVLSSCAADDTTATESGVELVEEGALTICTHLPYKPFEFNEGDEVVGFDIDVLKIAAEQATEDGLDTKIVDTSWETIVSGEALNTNQCDVAAGAMTITDERAAVMDFTDPYFEATQALMTQTGTGITDLDQLGGKSIAVQDSTTGAAFVEENAPEDAKVVTFEDSSLMQQAVKTGQTDAGVNDNGLLNYFASQNDDVEVTNEFSTGESYGFSVKQGGNDALLEVINEAIASDEYDAAYEKWFGKSAD